MLSENSQYYLLLHCGDTHSNLKMVITYSINISSNQKSQLLKLILLHKIFLDAYLNNNLKAHLGGLEVFVLMEEKWFTFRFNIGFKSLQGMWKIKAFCHFQIQKKYFTTFSSTKNLSFKICY